MRDVERDRHVVDRRGIGDLDRERHRARVRDRAGRRRDRVGPAVARDRGDHRRRELVRTRRRGIGRVHPHVVPARRPDRDDMRLRRRVRGDGVGATAVVDHRKLAGFGPGAESEPAVKTWRRPLGVQVEGQEHGVARAEVERVPVIVGGRARSRYETATQRVRSCRPVVRLGLRGWRTRPDLQRQVIGPDRGPGLERGDLQVVRPRRGDRRAREARGQRSETSIIVVDLDRGGAVRVEQPQLGHPCRFPRSRSSSPWRTPGHQRRP